MLCRKDGRHYLRVQTRPWDHLQTSQLSLEWNVQYPSKVTQEIPCLTPAKPARRRGCSESLEIDWHHDWRQVRFKMSLTPEKYFFPWESWASYKTVRQTYCMVYSKILLYLQCKSISRLPGDEDVNRDTIYRKRSSLWASCMLKFLNLPPDFVSHPLYIHIHLHKPLLRIWRRRNLIYVVHRRTCNSKQVIRTLNNAAERRQTYTPPHISARHVDLGRELQERSHREPKGICRRMTAQLVHFLVLAVSR